MSAAGSVAARGIDLYRIFLRPLRASGGATCRFTPSCSEYAAQAFGTWGFFRGLWLSVKRIGRCHPWGGFGDDPVPERPASAGTEVTHHLEALTAQPHQPGSTHVCL